jgi:hypothetical protein
MIFRTTTSGGTQNNNLTITPAGNVGIGLTNPSAKLHLSTVFADSPLEEAFRIQRSGLSSYNGERAIGMVFADDANFTLTSAVTGIRQNPSGHYLGGLSFRVSTSVSNAVTTIGGLTEVGRFTSDGRLGIGTVTPSELLDVNGRARVRTIDSTASAMNVLYADATGVIKKASATAFPGGSGTTNYVPKWTGANTLGDSKIRETGSSLIYQGSSTTANAEFSIENDNTATYFYGSQTGSVNKELRFYFNGTSSGERIRLFNNGRVFIGPTPTDAGFQFDVNGTARINNDLRVNTTAGFNTLFTNPIGGGGVAMASTTDPTASANRLFSLGFGSVNYPAQARIEAYSTEAWSSTNRGSYLTFRTTPTGASGVQDRMMIGNDGFVGINTLSPLARLHVAGNMQSDNDAYFATSSGNVGIGTASPSSKLHVIGTGASTNSINVGLIVDMEATAAEQVGAGTAILFRGKSGGGNIANYDQAQIATNNTGSNNSHGLSFFYKPNASSPLTEAMTIYGNGNVGFGTITPSYPIDAVGTASLAANNIASGSSTRFRNIYTRSRANSAGISGDVYADQLFHVSGGSAFEIYNADANFPLVFGTGATERMRIDGSGNVGIGTTSPAVKLDVNGNVRGTRINSTGGVVDFDAQSGSNFIQVSGGAMSFANAGVINMRIASNGNVGMGNNSPSFNLHVQKDQTSATSITVSNAGTSSSSTIMQFLLSESGGTNGYFRRYRDGSGLVELGFTDALSFKGAVSGTPADRMRIDALGNVGIGTQSPVNFGAGTTTLTVNGTTLGAIQLQNGGVKSFDFYGSGTESRIETGTGNSLVFRIASAEQARFSAGNFGIGTNNPSNKLDVSGTFRSTGNSTLPGWIFKTTNIQEATDSSSSIWFRRTIDNQLNFTINPVTYQGLAALRFRNFGGGESNFWLSNGRLSFAGGTTESMTLIGSELFVGHSGSPTDAGDYKIQSSGNVRVAGKIDVTSSESIGHNIVRSGTSDIAAQIYSSNAWLLYGAESSTGGSILTGSTQYAAVVGSGYNRPLQFGTNSTVSMEIDSTGLVGINTTSPTERLDVNGKARIRTVDSTATGINMLYVDATGVVKKAAVPGSEVSYTTDVNTISSGWTFVKDSTRNLNHNFINVVQSTTTNEATATMQIAVYRTTSSFTTGSWQTVANVPSAYAPKTTVYFELPGYVGTETYYTSSNVRFTGAAEYTGVKVARVDPGGNVQVRIGTVSASAITGGTNHVIFPLTLTWVVYNIPQ